MTQDLTEESIVRFYENAKKIMNQGYIGCGYCGMNIQYSPHTYTYKTVNRSWKERLLTWPWRPWIKTKTIKEPGIYQMGNTIIAHTSYQGEIDMATKNQNPYSIFPDKWS
jgi:DNA-directed RNA polymerase subunit RPC12/RpoP